MFSTKLWFIILLLDTVSSQLYNAVDVDHVVTTKDFQCLQKQSIDGVFVRAYDPDGRGSFDNNSIISMNNAFLVGMTTQAYMIPSQAGKASTVQLDEVYRGFQSQAMNIDIIWIQISNHTTWPNDPTKNRNFIQSMIDRARYVYEIDVGVFTNYLDWNNITNHYSLNNNAFTYMWYWNSALKNGQAKPDFNDYRQIGAWQQPTVKQYLDNTSLCGMKVNRNVYSPPDDGSTLLRRKALPRRKGRFTESRFRKHVNS